MKAPRPRQVQAPSGQAQRQGRAAGAGAQFVTRISPEQRLLERIAFAGRGLSKRTVDAVLAGGIHHPERLLFMSEDEISRIPGIGIKGVSEVTSYRRRFRVS